MVLAHKQFDATDEQGNLLTGSVTVRVEFEAGGLGVPYGDRAGAVPLGNPFNNAGGKISFYAAAGNYKITVTQGSYSRVLRDVPIGLMQEADEDVTKLPLDGSEPMIGPIGFTHQISPDDPPTGVLALFAKDDDKLYTRNSDGEEVELGSPAGAIRNISAYAPTGDGSADDYGAFLDARDNGTGLVYISPPTVAYNFGTAFNTAGKPMAWLPDPSVPWTKLFDGGQFNMYRGRNSNYAEGVNIWRFSDRVFVGEPASKYAGGSTVSGTDDGNSWYGSLAGTDGGGYYLAANARLLVASGERVPGDGSTGNLPYGVVSVVKTSKGGFEATGQEAIAFGAYAATDLAGKSAWAYIAELQRAPGGNQIYALEAAAKNAGNNQIMTPNAQTPGVFGVWMNAGGDDAFGLAAANPSTAALVLLGRAAPSNIRWNTGLLFMKEALTSGQAILMSSVGDGGSHRIDWYNASDVRVFNITASATDSVGWYQHRDNTGLRIGAAGVDIALFETAALSPGSNDAAALGNTTRKWSDLFLASGGVIDFNSGDVTITHVSNRLLFAGAAGSQNAYTFDNTAYITSANEFFTAVRMESTHAGANAGPYFMFDRNSASPAASDLGGTMIWRFANASAAMVNMLSIEGMLLDPTASSEDAEIRLTATVAGSQLQKQMSISGGVQIGSPAGGYMGVGTLNLDNDLYKDGTKVVGARATGWAAATGTATRTTFATTTVTVQQLAERVKALIDDLTTHGLIGA